MISQPMTNFWRSSQSRSDSAVTMRNQKLSAGEFRFLDSITKVGLSYGHQQSLDFSFSEADCKEKARETGTADALL